MPLSSVLLHTVLPFQIRLNCYMLKEEEIDTVLSDLLKLYGYDFNYYSRDSLRRRLGKLFRLEKFASFDGLRQKIKNDPDYVTHLVDRITVNVTEMFRDPNVFAELRDKVLPALASLPRIRIWHAGCASGEEPYSLAILLHEAGLLDKSEIIATDINPLVITKARHATYRNSVIQLYEKNYKTSGGKGNFNSYFNLGLHESSIRSFLSEKVVFTEHNLASDLYLNRFNLIVCRNVVIYFDKELRDRVFNLFDLSMAPNAYLVLGEKETLVSSPVSRKFVQGGKEKIWKKVG